LRSQVQQRTCRKHYGHYQTHNHYKECVGCEYVAARDSGRNDHYKKTQCRKNADDVENFELFTHRLTESIKYFSLQQACLPYVKLDLGALVIFLNSFSSVPTQDDED
jgi:hypothetical protein